MLSPALSRPEVPWPLLLRAAAWWLVAGLLYASSLLLVPVNLPAAVFALLASLVCLPGARIAFREFTGIRVGGAAAAMVAMTLVLGAVVSAGWPADTLAEGTIAADELVVTASQASKP
jgi:hypothetical protein